jgi:hypothetical protein
MVDNEESISSAGVVIVNNTIAKMINQERSMSTPTRNNSVREIFRDNPNIESVMTGNSCLINGRGIKTNNKGISTNKVRWRICRTGNWDAMETAIKIESSSI